MGNRIEELVLEVSQILKKLDELTFTLPKGISEEEIEQSIHNELQKLAKQLDEGTISGPGFRFDPTPEEILKKDLKVRLFEILEEAQEILMRIRI